MNNKRDLLVGTGMLTVMAVVFTASILLSQTTTQPIIEDIIIEKKVEQEREWNMVTGDAELSGDTSGFMYFMNKNRSANPTLEYCNNLTNRAGGNENCYEWSDSLDTEMTGETPYDTAYDAIGKYRVNDTIGYNVSGSCWEIDWIRGNLTCDFDYATDVGPLQAMEVIEIANCTDFAYYHVYLQDADGGAGDGFQITHGETFNYSAIQFQVYY